MAALTYEWVGNLLTVFLAHSVPVHSYGLSSTAMCGISVDHYEIETKGNIRASVEAGADRPRCGACSDRLKVKGEG